MNHATVLPKMRSSGATAENKLNPNVSDERSGEQPKIILIDDDPVYGVVIGRWAQLEGVALDVYHSLDELGFVGLLSQYDVAIVDYDLGEINGKDVADYMAMLFHNKPMIMISSIDRKAELHNCPTCVKAFMNKAIGYEKIVQAAIEIHQKCKV